MIENCFFLTETTNEVVAYDDAEKCKMADCPVIVDHSGGGLSNPLGPLLPGTGGDPGP